MSYVEVYADRFICDDCGHDAKYRVTLMTVDPPKSNDIFYYCENHSRNFVKDYGFKQNEDGDYNEYYVVVPIECAFPEK